MMALHHWHELPDGRMYRYTLRYVRKEDGLYVYQCPFWKCLEYVKSDRRP